MLTAEKVVNMTTLTCDISKSPAQRIPTSSRLGSGGSAGSLACFWQHTQKIAAHSNLGMCVSARPGGEGDEDWVGDRVGDWVGIGIGIGIGGNISANASSHRKLSDRETGLESKLRHPCRMQASNNNFRSYLKLYVLVSREYPFAGYSHSRL